MAGSDYIEKHVNYTDVPQSSGPAIPSGLWKILIIDDEPSVHNITD